MEPTFQVLPPGAPQSPPPPKPKSFFESIGAGIAGFFVLLFKFKFLLLGGLKTFGSMFIMIWICILDVWLAVRGRLCLPDFYS